MIYRRTVLIVVIMVMMLSLLLSGCGEIAPDGKLVINEVVCSNGSSFLAEGVGSPDWIELYNGTDHDIDLAGYEIVRTDSTDKHYEIPEGVIAAGGYMLICATEAIAEECEYLMTGFNLPKNGTGIKIKNSEGVTLDLVNVPELKTDISYCRDGNGEFVFCGTPTPGSENAGVFKETLEEVEEIEIPQGLRINEAGEEFVEIYNAGTEPISLAAFYLSDDASNKSKWRFPYQTIEPGEYLLVSLVGEGEIAASFRLSSYETVVYLCYAGELYDSMDIAGLWDGMSRGIDAQGNSVYYIEPSPGMENGAGLESLELREMSEDDPLKINEIMLENANTLIDEDGDRPEWLELYNASDAAIELSDYYLSDDDTNLLKWQLPKEQLGAGEYMIIYLSGKDKGHHASFGIGMGEPVILTNYAELTAQTINIPEESRLDNISYGLQDGKWLYFGKGTPGRENTVHGSESITTVEKVDRMSLWITEVSATAKARSNEKDWIELYNGGDTAVDLSGWYLSDDNDNPRKYALSGKIEAKQYLVVSASGSSADKSSGTANFGISPSGEELILTDPQGGVADIFETGALRAGETSGRAAGDFSGERVFFDVPTKGAENGNPIGAQISAPTFSVEGGFYDSAVTVEITAAEGDIYYTTDGSEPTIESEKYTGPLQITENTPVSAIAVKQGFLSSDPAVNTYIIEEIPNIPTVCISIDDADFRSLYTVKFYTGQNGNTYVAKNIEEIERRCNIEYYETDGKLGVSFPGGIRVTGNGTRTYNQKSLAIFARAGYGQSNIVYPFFEECPVSEFQSLVLRNAGQNRDESRMSDVLASNVFQGMNLDSAYSKFVVVYINGKYYGIYDLKEKINESYFASYYGIDPETVNTIRRNTTAIAGTNQQIKEVYSYAQRWGTANDETFNKFTEYVDQYAWIDYIIARSYTGDGDIFNQKLWNTNDYQVKWRPIFFDCDFSFTGQGSTLGVYFKSSGQPSPDGTITNMHIGTALKKNEGWRDMFVKRYAEVLEWIPERSLELFDEYYAQLEPEMARHIKRWGTHSGLNEWKSEAQAQRKILEKRPYVVVKQIQNVFDVSDAEMKELFPKYYK